jgi:hypothetical protein
MTFAQAMNEAQTRAEYLAVDPSIDPVLKAALIYRNTKLAVLEAKSLGRNNTRGGGKVRGSASSGCGVP